MSSIILYHGGCNDGFTAAFGMHMALTALGEEPPELVPCYRPDKPEDVRRAMDACAGRDTYMVDYCYNSIEQMKGLAFLAASLTVIDHHKSAKPILDALQAWADTDEGTANSDVRIIFDLEKSGAGLVYRHMVARRPDMPQDQMPDMFRLTERYDLWQHGGKPGDEADAWVLGMSPLNKDVGTWEKAFHDSDSVLEEGWTLVAQRDAHVATVVATASITDEKPHFKGKRVAVCNCPPWLTSVVGYRLLALHPDIALASMMWIDFGKEQISVSLRSDDSREDVAAIAIEMGGGGHRNAAGFTLKMGDYDGNPNQ